MEDIRIVDRLKLNLYYIIIGIISFISLAFLPMVGTQMGLAWNVPNTTIGWIIWVVLKLVIATINILIFHSFMQQAKINVKDNPKYKEALEILGRIKQKNYIPRGPGKWTRQQYASKGVSLFITTALTTIAFTQAILTFDWLALLVYLFTIMMGIIFGVIQMKTAEEYWTDEFWKYAKMVEAEHEEEIKIAMVLAEEERIEQGNANMGTDSGSDILEPSSNNSNSSDNDNSVVVDTMLSNNSVLGGSVHTSSAITAGTSTILKENI